MLLYVEMVPIFVGKGRGLGEGREGDVGWIPGKQEKFLSLAPDRCPDNLRSK